MANLERTCSTCGGRFENIGALAKHKPNCPGRADAKTEPEAPEESGNQTVMDWGFAIAETIRARGLDPNDFANWVKVVNESAQPGPDAAERHVIPFSVCPDVKLLKPGTRVGLRIVAEIKADGMAVEEGRLL